MQITHPKVLSFPLGVRDREGIWRSIQQAVSQEYKKDKLLFSASSSWGLRPHLLDCVKQRMKNELTASLTKLSLPRYYSHLITARLVLCMPGLGYDTYRIWETLIAGSMPVLEKGVGLDRTLWKLPALLVEDFSSLSPSLLRSAYIEALYRAERGEWEYERVGERWWIELVRDTARTGSTDILLNRHPMNAVDEHFVRPLWPYNCNHEKRKRREEGDLSESRCENGARRPPKDSCLIHDDADLHSYQWNMRGIWRDIKEKNNEIDNV
mmetsp:Transcript_6907/g.7152  ORF Transcript_6907/g.7152 Transcript_6907/m.7152 type:complete len:267 (-) Transcript_6907:220-1020(-)